MTICVKMRYLDKTLQLEVKSTVMRKLVLVFALTSTASLTRPLDKIAAVVDDTTYTLSEVERGITNIGARRQIAPFIYRPSINPTLKGMATLMVNRFLIREHLTSIGHVVADAEVEQQIQETQRRLGLGRRVLLEFLEGNNMVFKEYFELIRESIEFNIFQERVIRPLVSVTDQEVKSEYYKRNQSDKTLSFNLSLMDFSLERSRLKEEDVEGFPDIIKKFQETANIPERFQGVAVNDLGEVKEDGLSEQIRDALRGVEEGAFSKTLLLGGRYHVFFVKKKDLVESDDFLRSKDQLMAMLYMRASEKATDLWVEREAANHYIKYFL